MKPALTIMTLTCCVLLGHAQDRIPNDEAEAIAKVLSEHAAKLDKLQLKTTVDAAKPYGQRQDKYGAMVIPQTKLTLEVDKEVLPLGQFWLRNLSPVVNGKPVDGEKLRIVKVSADGEDHMLPFFLLGVRARADKSLELVVYAKDQEPLLTMPLEKAEAKQDLPLEFSVQKGDDGETAMLTLKVAGKYQAKIKVVRQDQ
jgi:hypothetical protein